MLSLDEILLFWRLPNLDLSAIILIAYFLNRKLNIMHLNAY